MFRRLIPAALGGLLAGGLAAGCARQATALPALPTVTPTTAAPATVTATAEPLAARVNGQPITLADFEKEAARFEIGQRALGLDPAALPDYRSTVLERMIDEALILQAAAAAGLTAAEAEAQAQYEAAAQAAGGAEAFQAWLAEHLYTDDEFRAQLRAQLTVAAAQAPVAAQVPAAAEQVHARHILVGGEAEARSALEQLEAGADFATLAYTYSLDLSTRTNGGDLGWFPRGRLSQPSVEEAAFALAPGQRQIVQSALGYHVVETLERDPARALSPADRLDAQRRAVADWIQRLRAGAAIERFVP